VPEKKKDGPRTTAKPITKKKRENLTPFDWMTVFSYIDDHPTLSQDDIVKYFQTRHKGVLKFDQSTLSCKIRDRKKLEDWANDHPNALSSKHPCVVTHPDVEKALILWVRSMEEKGETVTGPMLVAKHMRFEEVFDVPHGERLIGDGWVLSFCKAYNIKEHQRHGEASSVDLIAVKAERACLQALLAKYPVKDCFNFDESSLFAL